MALRPADGAGIAAAAARLRRGGLVAFPTETVYGLGADAGDDRAVARIFGAKGRPRFNPLIVHAPDLAAHRAWAVFDERALRLADAFWPGALTLVLPRTPDAPVSRLVSAGLDTVAVRAPDHPVAQALMRAAGCPVAAPSANRSGRLSPTEAGHVAASLGGAADLILDGGPCPGGLESTVLSLTGEVPVLLRPGLVSRDTIESAVGPVETAGPALPGTLPGTPLESPGMLAAHYAPRAPLRLEAGAAQEDGEALLAFGAAPTPGPASGVASGYAAVRNLSPAGDLTEAAANLFRLLHELDALAPDAIAVAPVPEDGLGVAINDRLRRAAARD
ncbi:MAG: threonylcarbamoyl-AMP synthase [Rhodospirillaceae bacterium]|nr:threonylcarbamoyl-AMP synthase [Rhodospirillaceae bacterium]MYB13713.1 threonylcarbamoyl-AMP synthase [Rhodospirillaceae bacterium]MYI47996.1 threonylcarbamoyl-AMP synthase [Rhodospirillaceae bacterium]